LRVRLVVFFYPFPFTLPSTSEIYTLSLHDALPISQRHLHATGGPFAFGRRRGHVVGVGSVAVTDDFAINLRAARLGVAQFLQEQDRKSTRLNSSHGSISYAVFCLKKKKKKIKTTKE